jgi:hypothetical protein
MARYIIMPIVHSRFKTSGYDLSCKICGEPINPFDVVESKASGGSEEGGPKLYHAECYDEAHYGFEYNEENLMNIYEEYGIDEIKIIFWEFNKDMPDDLSLEQSIDMILNLQEQWIADNHNT